MTPLVYVPNYVALDPYKVPPSTHGSMVGSMGGMGLRPVMRNANEKVEPGLVYTSQPTTSTKGRVSTICKSMEGVKVLRMKIPQMRANQVGGESNFRDDNVPAVDRKVQPLEPLNQ